MNTFAASASVFLSVVVAIAAEEPQQPAHDNKSPFLESGALQTFREPMQQICRFVFAASSLQLDREAWEKAAAELPQPADPMAANLPPGLPAAPRFRLAATPPSAVERLFQQIEDRARSASAGFSSGRGGSGTEFHRRFSGNSLSGSLRVRGDGVQIVLEEREEPQRTLEFSAEGLNVFRIQLTHADGDLIALAQARSGRFTVITIRGSEVFAAQSSSFSAFVHEHRRRMETDILPVLEQFGVSPVPPTHSQSVSRLVLAAVARTPEATAEGEKLLADLDHDEFAVREEASARLQERFERYWDLIQRKLQDPAASVEAQTRLRRIIAQQGGSRLPTQMAAEFELLKDARYLVSLMDHVTPDEARALASYLEQLTGQKLGAEPSAWKQWAAERPQ